MIIIWLALAAIFLGYIAIGVIAARFLATWVVRHIPGIDVTDRRLAAMVIVFWPTTLLLVALYTWSATGKAVIMNFIETGKFRS